MNLDEALQRIEYLERENAILHDELREAAREHRLELQDLQHSMERERADMERGMEGIERQLEREQERWRDQSTW